MASSQMPGEGEREGERERESIERDWHMVERAEAEVEVEVEVEVESSFQELKLDDEEKYPAKLHARAVAKRLGVKEGLIFLPGTRSKTYEDSDQEVFFRQRRYFYYLCGINYPDCFVTYDIGRDCVIAWIPIQNQGRTVIYNGFSPSREDIRKISDLHYVTESNWLRHYLNCYVKGSPSQSKIYLLHEAHEPKLPNHFLNEDGSNTIAPAARFDFTKLQPAMDAARVVKSPYELKAIRNACAITAEAHINVLANLKSFENESEIEAWFAGTCIALQAKHQAYGIIAGSGKNASVLHYVTNNEPLEGRQLVVLDAGCEWQEYASDVTRTFPISGTWTHEAESVYGIVAKMQEECIKMVKPGADYRKIHMHAHKIAIKGLMDLGLLQNGTFQELYSAGASLAFFPHGLGHYMGLEVHDVGTRGALLYGFKRTPRINWENAYFSMGMKNPSLLEPGMVITVEPGIYFSRYALEEIYLKDPKYAKYINRDLLDKYYPVGGVRIEDDILVTEDGYENLTTAVPKGDAALKIINGELEVKKEKKGWFW